MEKTLKMSSYCGLFGIEFICHAIYELLSKKNALTRHFWLQEHGKVAFLPQESADRNSAREDLYTETFFRNTELPRPFYHRFREVNVSGSSPIQGYPAIAFFLESNSYAAGAGFNLQVLRSICRYNEIESECWAQYVNFLVLASNMQICLHDWYSTKIRHKNIKSYARRKKKFAYWAQHQINMQT